MLERNGILELENKDRVLEILGVEDFHTSVILQPSGAYTIKLSNLKGVDFLTTDLLLEKKTLMEEYLKSHLTLKSLYVLLGVDSKLRSEVIIHIS